MHKNINWVYTITYIFSKQYLTILIMSISSKNMEYATQLEISFKLKFYSVISSINYSLTDFRYLS